MHKPYLSLSLSHCTNLESIKAFHSALVATRPLYNTSLTIIGESGGGGGIRPTAQDVRRQVLDQALWQLVRRWQGTHRNLNTKKLAVLLLLNESDQAVQVVK